MNPFKVSLESIAKAQNVNCKRFYDTLVIYGDINVENESRVIEFPTPKLWVKGNITISGCTHISSLPQEEIEANEISFCDVPNVKKWPAKLVADTVNLKNIGDSDSACAMQIYAASLISDCASHNPDPALVFGLRLIPQPPSSTMAEVIDANQNIIWRAYPKDLLDLHESGHLKDIKDSRCIQSLLQDIELIPSGSRVYPIEDARSAWAVPTRVKTKGIAFGVT